MEETKATFKIILFFVLIGIAIIVPFIVFQDINHSDKDFLEYQNINLNKIKLEDEVEYANIKNQLETDYYFQKLATMFEYNNENYSPEKLEEMMWHFIFNYDITNTKHFSYIDKPNDIYCLSKNKIIKAFKELYDIDISESINLLKGFYEYVYEKEQGYCLDFGNVANGYDNEIKIAIEKIEKKGGVITTEFYLYEYYTPNSNDYNTIDLENAIRNNNYVGAENIVKNKLYGKISHKQMKFKINKYADYFKYQILSMKNLEY